MSEFDQIVNICNLLNDKKANDILLIDVSKILSYTDNVVIATATSFTHAKALANFVAEKADIEPITKEGFNESSWIIIDYGFVIVHIMTKDLRDYYNLEKLYSDGKAKKYEAVIKDIEAKLKKEAKQRKIQEKKEQKVAKKEPKAKAPKEKTVEQAEVQKNKTPAQKKLKNHEINS